MRPVETSLMPSTSIGMISLVSWSASRRSSTPKHPRDRKAPDVGVEEPDPETLIGQGDRQVHAHGRLADPTLARAHRHHPGRGVDLGGRRVSRARSRAPVIRFARWSLVMAVVRTTTSLTPGRPPMRAGGLALEVVAHRALGDRQRQTDRDGAVGVDIDRSDHAQVDEIASQLGVDDTSQSLVNVIDFGHTPRVTAPGRKPQPQASAQAQPASWRLTCVLLIGNSFTAQQGLDTVSNDPDSFHQVVSSHSRRSS